VRLIEAGSLVAISALLSGCTLIATGTRAYEHFNASNTPNAQDQSSVSASEATISESKEGEPAGARPAEIDEFSLEATPEMNLIVFTEALRAANAGIGRIELEPALEALDAAGVPRELIAHTAWASKVQFPVDSLSISVDLGENCLIGQYSTTWLETSITPKLSPGTCLIGDVTTLTAD
jgi:hypothetical protein